MRLRVTLSSVLAAIALVVVLSPSVVFAADDPDAVSFPYYGGLSERDKPLLPCTGFVHLEGTVQVKKMENDANGIPREVLDEDKNNIYVPKDYKFDAVGVTTTNGLRQCQSMCDVLVFGNRLIILALSLLVTIFLPLMIIIGGFYILTGGGNPGQRATGMKIIQGTLVGLAITVGAFLIVNQMLVLIFKQGYGNALQAELKDQIKKGQLGITEKDIPSFSWNSITCSVDPKGAGVIVTPPKETPAETNTSDTNTGDTNTGGTNTDRTNTNGSSCQSAGGTCINSSQSNATNYCGGTITTDSCPNTNAPNCCKKDPSHSCNNACAGQNATWTGEIKNNNCVCLLNKASPTDKSPLCETEGNKCAPSDTTDAACGTTFKAGERGCSASQRCCKQAQPTTKLSNLNCNSKTFSQQYSCVESTWNPKETGCAGTGFPYGCRYSFDNACNAVCNKTRSWSWDGTKDKAGKCHCL